MTQPKKSLRDQISEWAADDTIRMAFRYGGLFLLFLAVTLGMFFALRQWHAPELPPDGKATELQYGFYTIGGGALIAAVVTWAVAALHRGEKQERPIWFCPLLAAGLGLAIYLMATPFWACGLSAPRRC